jgi:hypothetical protein
MFFEKPGSVKILYTVAVTGGMTSVRGADMTRDVVPEVAQVEFWADDDGISWTVRVQGHVQRKDGTAGASIQEHEFSSFWHSHGITAPEAVLAFVERFQPRAVAAIAAGRE